MGKGGQRPQGSDPRGGCFSWVVGIHPLAAFCAARASCWKSSQLVAEAGVFLSCDVTSLQRLRELGQGRGLGAERGHAICLASGTKKKEKEPQSKMEPETDPQRGVGVMA